MNMNPGEHTQAVMKRPHPILSGEENAILVAYVSLKTTDSTPSPPVASSSEFEDIASPATYQVLSEETMNLTRAALPVFMVPSLILVLSYKMPVNPQGN